MRMPFPKKWLIIALILLVIALPLLLRAKSANAGKPVQAQTVALQAIRPTILASGTLAYRTEVALTASSLSPCWPACARRVSACAISKSSSPTWSRYSSM